MSARTLVEIADNARQAALTVTWAQWAALGTMASSKHRSVSVVDPEALVLTSLVLRDHEPRLWDVLDQWSRFGVRLLSVQRVKNLLSSYPAATRHALSEFVALARNKGRDARWKPKFFDTAASVRPSRGKQHGMSLDFFQSAALMLRLRRGFGVNLRSDILSFLIANGGKPVTIRVMARSLHYTDVAVRRSVDDLAGARLVHASKDERPTAYSVTPEAWATVLGLATAPPAWRHWHEIFILITQLHAWARDARDRKVSGYALDALGRDFVDRHRAAFVRNDIPLSQRPGAPVLDLGSASSGRVSNTRPGGQFEAQITHLTQWMLDQV